MAGQSFDFSNLFEGASPTADDLANKWSQWNGARSIALDRWKEVTNYLYATSTRETPNGNSGGFEEDEDSWTHSTHVPKLTQIYDNLVANYTSAVFPKEEFFDFIGQDEASTNKDKRKVAKSYLKSKHRLNKIKRELASCISDFVQYGNSFGEVSFLKEFTVDAEGLTTRTYTGPKFSRISPLDIVFNPQASSFEASPKIIRRLKTLGEIARLAEESPDSGYLLAAFDTAMQIRSRITQIDQSDFNKHVQLAFDGFGSPSLYYESGMVEILEFYGDYYDETKQELFKNHVITVMDRKIILRSEPLDTTNGKPHIYHAGWRGRADNVWSMGPLDNLVGMQYMINHLENSRADAFDQMLQPTRVEVGYVESEGVVAGQPGGTYRIPSGEGSVANLLPDTTVLSADIQIQNKMSWMEEFAGAPRQEMGIRTPGEKTATEVDSLSRASSKIFQEKLALFEDFLEDVLNAELELGKTFLDVVDVIEVLGEDGVKTFENIRKSDLQSNGAVVPIGARVFARKLQLLKNLQLMQQTVDSDPLTAQHFSSVKKAQLLEELTDFDGTGLMSAYVRVSEEAELVKLQNVAQQQVESENNVEVGDELTEETEDTGDL